MGGAARRPPLVPDLLTDAEPHWPVFAAEAQRLPVRAVFSFPLSVGDPAIGVLDCSRATAGLLEPSAVHEARVLADTDAVELLVRVLAADDPDGPGEATGNWSGRGRSSRRTGGRSTRPPG